MPAVVKPVNPLTDPVRAIFVAVIPAFANPACPIATLFAVASPILRVPAVAVSILFDFTFPLRFIVVPVMFAVVAPARPK